MNGIIIHTKNPQQRNHPHAPACLVGRCGCSPSSDLIIIHGGVRMVPARVRHSFGPFTKMHAGPVYQFFPVEEHLQSHVQPQLSSLRSLLSPAQSRFVICGHSFGCVVAGALAYKFSQSGVEVQGLVDLERRCDPHTIPSPLPP